MKNFFLFNLIAFGPGLLVIGMLLAFILLPGLAFGGHSLMNSLPDMVTLLGVILLPLIAVGAAYPLARYARSWWVKGLVIYLAWQVLALAAAFVLAGALAGVSMAAAEGIVSGWDLKLQELGFALVLLLPMQLLILPWTLAATLLLRWVSVKNTIYNEEV